MKHVLPNLESMKVFESAARHLSFIKAADELCLTKGAVSYQIKKLESELATDLFKRDIRQVWLTDAGQKLFQSVQPLFDDLEKTVAQMKRNRLTDTVSIAVTTYVAARWLSPLLTDFLVDNPSISLKYEHAVNNPSFRIQDSDIAIQWGRCTGEINDVRLMEIPMPLYPAYSPNAFTDIEDALLTGALLDEDRDLDLWKEWSDQYHDLTKNPRRVVADANVRVQAAIDGHGLILADDMMAAELLSGALVGEKSHALEGYGYVVMSTPAKRSRAAKKLLLWLEKHIN